MKPKFIELNEIHYEYSVKINVEQILLMIPYKDEDHGLITILELKNRTNYFGGPLKVAETVEEIIQKIGE